jgi:hypothetical protein
MRVVIAGDSVLLREGLARLLADAGHRRVLAPSPPRPLRTRSLGAHPPASQRACPRSTRPSGARPGN